jgi:endonuclease YncB( thermonuclease family)
MNAMPANQPAQKRRLPKWLKITLSVFGALFVLGAIFGKPPEETTQPAAAASAPTTTSATTISSTTTAPPVETYTVVGVVDGSTVKVISAGVEKTVRVLGIRTAPQSGPSCFASETMTWANQILAGRKVTLQIAQAALDQADNTLAYLKLPNGDDYSTIALKAGYAKYVIDGVAVSAASALQSAESLARTASTGLWGAPCKGNIDAPAQVAVPAPPQPKPVTAAPSTTQAPKPKPTTAAPVEPDPPAAVYYKNCTAARAAGVTPLYRGQPGYGSHLDRDNDGVACE